LKNTVGLDKQIKCNSENANSINTAKQICPGSVSHVYSAPKRYAAQMTGTICDHPL